MRVILESQAHQALDVVEVTARRDLGYHTAVRPVFVVLRQHAIGKDPPPLVDHRGGCLVTARFDSEDDHGLTP
jgi:hypothetical protein